ncbi:mevalonate kinase [Agaribacterium haliotis]|uniref:mevalonate kinase n=1 Tax=Agaribacterium haliotis TaxID=2013869 RepID=UPI0013043895|nr:mevalonate kinase [Agaribacterium haliotis]
MLEFEQLGRRRASSYVDGDGWVGACGKVILFGEHSVVYGQPAIAAGIERAVRVRVERSTEACSSISIERWNISVSLADKLHGSAVLLQNVLKLICRHFAVEQPVHLSVDAQIPHASGLGASAALAVACSRALALFAGQDSTNEEINELAFACEKLAHGNPSGLDNSLACYGGLFRFQRLHSGVDLKALSLAQPLNFLVALSGKQGFTAKTVARVRQLWLKNKTLYDELFEQMGELTREAEAILAVDTAVDKVKLGKLINRNQACLRQLGVSCAEIEDILELASAGGATAGKLTGSGDGGAVLLLSDHRADVQQALAEKAYSSFSITIAG